MKSVVSGIFYKSSSISSLVTCFDCADFIGLNRYTINSLSVTLKRERAGMRMNEGNRL